MMKQKGFTVIDVIILLLILAIAAAAALLPACQKYSDQKNPNDETLNELINIEVLDAPMEYIRRDLRTNEHIKLKRHDDGSLWACFTTTETCHMVIE